MREQASFDVVPKASLYPDAHATAAYLKALFEDSPVATVALDAQHRFVMCNRAFHLLFQFSHEELMATDLDDLIAGPDAVEEAHEMSRAVLRGERVHMVTQRRRKDGMTVDVEIHGNPLTVDGRLSGVYAVYQDVTERNRARTAFRQLSALLDNLQQEERRRVARDLHDSTSQELAVLNWNLAELMKLVDDKNVRLQELVLQTRELAAQCSSRIRSATYLLHPPMLGKAGLYGGVRRLSEEFEQRSGIRVHLEVPLTPRSFPDAVECALYRALQEALANVLRHSGSPAVHIKLRLNSSWLMLLISDEGRCVLSPGTHALRSSTGVGIAGMRERIDELGGHLVVERTERGTTVMASVPVGGADA